ncbi:Hsp90 ATPase activator, amine-terminal protein (macronuclear) [Tetrahymena thermophila SB210]|uniref:Hsp90 ATPase activator, amine-terminal protein n=1 Tax=Tetrahymena thermophila (strain SB210) TaxID=312017 RepID=I7LSZ0_TETTS|nr:Hsp90 ATPase activator, amine-terminal protein [Tetrahymena thermophila SB210]EAR83931.4 Hsp90 ATPase activator, amine-terminal protein [Tetrahymena thermophila SB210]|eukprot:XP_001031594.4 Hsp90 ATPase activator, amine-terminal protein [Tetrahymena thermophila SB210]
MRSIINYINILIYQTLKKIKQIFFRFSQPRYKKMSTSEEEIKQEPPKTKKEHSYTYWVDKEKQNNPNIVQKEPKKIDPTQIQQNQSKHVSQWNQIGTWEEKKIELSQVKEILEKGFKESPVQSVDQRIEFYNISKLEGDVSIVTVRGKKKPGYHLKLNVKYRGIGDYKGAKGVFKYTSFSDDGDRDFEVEGAGENHKEICKKSAQDSSDLLEQHILKLFQLIHE